MSQLCRKIWFITGSLTSVLICTQSIAAQVRPDATLPVGERSQVTGNRNVQIDGGARRGSNLFHSFSQFSVPTGGSAFFNNAAGVRNIFSRVTSGSVSHIDGVIRANGRANLFLLNPSGILFGSNARLNIGGSFIASTADSINFADQFQYSATNPQSSPLLTVSVPVGLQMGVNSRRIAVQGNGYDLSVAVPIFSPIVRGSGTAGLQVPVGQTLALIGGNIAIDGGTLTAEQGRIELGSVRSGQVSLGDNFALSYSGVQTFGNIRLSQQALADASGGGSIQVQGHRVSLTDGSIVLIQNQGTRAGGSIRVTAAQLLDLNGSSPDGGIYGGLIGETAGVRRGADIVVSTQQLAIQGGAGIVTRSYSSGDAGNITVNASTFIQLIGVSSINPSLASVIGSGLFNTGTGGAVTVSTGRLSVLEGGTVATVAFGTGKGGELIVNATEAVEIIGVSPIFSRSTVASNALNAGDAGAVTINTARLTIQNGASLNSSTLAAGNAGSVTINASNFVEISGVVLGNSLASRVGSSAAIVVESLRQVFRLPDRPSGNAGSVTINTPRLNISNGANIGVNNDGTGNAGTLQINANSIVVERGGSITAATESGEGGNLDLNVRDVLRLQNNSQITTSAGGTGNGGNIRIHAGAIAAVPTENNDIRANSANARGGNISINASSIFGIQPRSQNTPLSDITATGATSALSGAIDVTTAAADPTPGLLALPTDVGDASQLITQGCPANEGNLFVVTGRGGLPPTPEQQLDDDARWNDRRRLTVPQETRTRRRENNQQLESRASESRASESGVSERRTPIPIIEATQWHTTPTGEILLVANIPNPISPMSPHQAIACNDIAIE